LSRTDCQFVIADLYSNSWFNLANEMFKKASLLLHLIKTFGKTDSYYRYIPVDDWSENKHEAVTKAIERRGGRYYAIDNQVSRGFWVYLATAQAPGFEPTEDLATLVLGAVRGHQGSPGNSREGQVPADPGLKSAQQAGRQAPR
jgi:hypothetical protein